LLYAYAGEVEGKERDEDRLAYLRRENEYRNILLVEQPNGDFAVTIVRQLLYAAYAQPYFAALARSKDPMLAGIAGKAVKELVYHVRHCGEWTIRLGDGTAESHRRAQAALEELWPFTGEMFEVDELEQTLIDAAVAVDPRTIRPQWERTLDPVFAEAMLRVPDAAWMQSGGRRGHHTEHLGYILAELQYLQRAHPGATW
jgi:ring-1,2-phenylacetyl-CoA epoxidase subunit PaaC